MKKKLWAKALDKSKYNKIVAGKKGLKINVILL